MVSGDGYLAQLIRSGNFSERSDVLQYDLEQHGRSMKRFTRMLLDRLTMYRSRQLPAGLSSANHNITGHAWTARWLVVGDCIGAGAGAWTGWPLCWHDGQSIGTWFNKAVHHLGVREQDLLVTNANDSTDDQLPYLLELGLPVIALGRRAEERLYRLRARDMRLVSHPKHHMIANPEDGPEGYAAELQGALY
jgi:hypothetical protein